MKVPDLPEPWVPLSLARIEKKPKRVVLDKYFKSKSGLSSKEEQDFADITARIERGEDLSAYYRASTGYDKLVKEHQVMHLHLGGKGSDALLYLIQYPECVLFLCVDSHIHLNDVPVGKRFPLLGRRSHEKGLKAACDEGTKRSGNPTDPDDTELKS